MVQLYKKLTGQKIGNAFKKVSGDINRAFKKGGVVEKTIGRVGSGLAKGAEVVGKVANIGSNILGQVQKSPLGALVPTPILGYAQQGLKGLAGIGKIAGAGADVSKELTSGKGAKQIAGNVIERAVQAKEETKSSFR